MKMLDRATAMTTGLSWSLLQRADSEGESALTNADARTDLP